MISIDKDRVISPTHTLHTDMIREPSEIFHYLLLIRHIRLDIPAIWCDRHKPVLTIRLEMIQVWKDRSGILGTESDQVHDVG